jgi:hypothetical protein
MKIRTGFISNSSSSSFVARLPENFDINAIDFQHWANMANATFHRKLFRFSSGRVKKMTENCIKAGGCHEGEKIFRLAPGIFKSYITLQTEVEGCIAKFTFEK